MAPTLQKADNGGSNPTNKLDLKLLASILGHSTPNRPNALPDDGVRGVCGGRKGNEGFAEGVIRYYY